MGPYIKMEMRGFTVMYAKRKAKQRNNEEVSLQIESNPNNLQNLNDL